MRKEELKTSHRGTKALRKTQRGIQGGIRGRRLLIIFVLVMLLCGCSGVSGKLLIMEGNYWNSRGMYNEAISPYMRALEYKEAAPYAEYGLGSVYFALGEETAALDRFAAAKDVLETSSSSVNKELRYRVHYNTGVALFSGGDFSAAADSFRDALRTDGRRMDAKRNLELCIRLLTQDNLHSGGDSDAEGESKAVLFEYIRQRELNQYQSREWAEEEPITGPDY